MTSRLSSTLAALSAAGLLAFAPAGVAVGWAIGSREPIGAALARIAWPLELVSACAWAALFLVTQWLSRRYRGVRSAPQNTVVCLLALAVGAVGFYAAESPLDRALLSAQYAVLVLLAFLLFDFLADRGPP